VLATMIRAADRRCRASISGLDPPPANTDHRKSNKHKGIAA
jgi:hypothetical protein